MRINRCVLSISNDKTGVKVPFPEKDLKALKNYSYH